MEPARTFATYRHYKGGVYVKLGDALHTETDEILTIYTCAVSGALFCRPKAMFDEILSTPTYSGPRFVPFPEATTKIQRQSFNNDSHP